MRTSSTGSSNAQRFRRVVSNVGAVLQAMARGQELAPVGFAEQPRPRKLNEVSVGGVAATTLGGVVGTKGGVIANPDDLVDVKGGLEIYDEMRRDDAIGAFMQFRKWARQASGWKVVPASDSNEDKRVAQFVEFVLMRYVSPDIRTFMQEMMTAYDYGYALAEKVWKRVDEGEWAGRWGYCRLAPKRPHSFKFDVDALGNLKPNGIINVRGYGDEVPMLVEDFVLYPYAAEFGNPYGTSDLRRAHTWWVMKKHLVRYQAIYFERLAGGFFDVAYDPNEVEETEIDDMESALAGITLMSNLLHPKGFEVNITESSGRGALSYDKAIQTVNSYNARTVLIPDLMGLSTKATGGSYAMAAKHHDTFLWVLEAMGGDLETKVFSEQVIRPLVELNYGKKYELPQFKFKPLSHEDRIKILTLFITAVEKGVLHATEEDAKWVRSVLEAPETDGDPEEERPPQVPGFEEPDEEEPDGEQEEPDGEETPPDGDDEKQTVSVVEYNALRRRLKSYELRTDFGLIEGVMDKTEAYAEDVWKGVAQKQLDNLLKTVRSRRLVENADYAGVRKLQLRKAGEVEATLRRSLCTAFANARFQSWRELQDRKESMDFTIERYADAVILEPVEPTDAITFFKKKGLVISPSEFKPYKESAYYITGVESSALLSKAKAIVVDGIRKGDRIWMEAQLKRLFDRYIETGRLRDDGQVASAFHIETVVRNNISEAYNQGRMATYHDPAVIDEVEGYWYSAVLDDATTAYCEWMDKNSPFTKEEFEREGPPPAHHRCRSTFGAILRGEAWSPKRLAPPSGAVRGEGFVRREAYRAVTHT